MSNVSPTEDYVTAPLEAATSDPEDMHNVSAGSLSENSSWDNYQVSES